MLKKSNHTNILIIKAKEDFETANNLIKLKHFSEEIVLFHCQQALEKALKAYLDSKKINFPKSHDIEMLLSLCIKTDSTFHQIGFITPFTAYAVEIRYDELVDISREKISEMILQTKEALRFILDKIK